MATVKEHYNEVLADVYSWMSGGFDSGIRRNADFFKRHKIKPEKSGAAVDLGAGCGFQSIPLAEAGYSVTSIDLDAKLLKELEVNSQGLDIKIIQGDLADFKSALDKKVELIVCMTDTISHLDSKETVSGLFKKVYEALEPGGKFVITFRDLTRELKEIDRFIPVRSSENTIFTCFLEYEYDTVKVYDIVYKKTDDEWQMFKSFYRKLRLSEEWVREQLLQCGFNLKESYSSNGLITCIALTSV